MSPSQVSLGPDPSSYCLSQASGGLREWTASRGLTMWVCRGTLFRCAAGFAIFRWCVELGMEKESAGGRGGSEWGEVGGCSNTTYFETLYLAL